MDNGDILREIIALTRSKCECSEETESVLFENKCLYLLTQSINNRRDISHVLATNRIVTEIEYSICSSLFKRLLDSF